VGKKRRNGSRRTNDVGLYRRDLSLSFCDPGGGLVGLFALADPRWTFKSLTSVFQTKLPHCTFPGLVAIILDLLDEPCDHSGVGGATVCEEILDLR